MATDFRNPAATGAIDRAAIDEGLRSYMLRVYNYMASGLLLSTIVALLVVQSEAAMQLVFNPGTRLLVFIVTIGMLMVMSFGFNRVGPAAMQAMYWVFVSLMGTSLAAVFVIYNLGDIVRVFLITAITFGAMSLYGYTTKRDLTGWGSFLFMGLIGIIIAGIVNMFLGSSVLQMAISVIGVIVFVGLTAFDTQQIKSDFIVNRMQGGLATKSAVMGAVRLYLDFLNLFMLLLSLLGNRE